MVFCSGALAPDLGVAEPSSQGSERAPSESPSQPASVRPSEQEQGAKPDTMGKSADGHPPGQQGMSDASHKSEQAGARRSKPKPRSALQEIKPTASNRDHSTGGRGESDQRGSGSKSAPNLYRPALSQFGGASKDGSLRGMSAQQRNLPSFPSRGMPALPVNPARNRGPATAVIGGPVLSGPKSTAALSGTGLKHKP